MIMTGIVTPKVVHNNNSGENSMYPVNIQSQKYGGHKVKLGSDDWVGSLSCYATVVVTVARHHDVTMHSPVSTPAESRMGMGE